MDDIHDIGVHACMSVDLMFDTATGQGNMYEPTPPDVVIGKSFTTIVVVRHRRHYLA